MVLGGSVRKPCQDAGLPQSKQVVISVDASGVTVASLRLTDAAGGGVQAG